MTAASKPEWAESNKYVYDSLKDFLPEGSALENDLLKYVGDMLQGNRESTGDIANIKSQLLKLFVSVDQSNLSGKMAYFVWVYGEQHADFHVEYFQRHDQALFDESGKVRGDIELDWDLRISGPQLNVTHEHWDDAMHSYFDFEDYDHDDIEDMEEQWYELQADIVRDYQNSACRDFEKALKSVLEEFTFNSEYIDPPVRHIFFDRDYQSAYYIDLDKVQAPANLPSLNIPQYYDASGTAQDAYQAFLTSAAEQKDSGMFAFLMINLIAAKEPSEKGAQPSAGAIQSIEDHLPGYRVIVDGQEQLADVLHEEQEALNVRVPLDVLIADLTQIREVNA